MASKTAPLYRTHPCALGRGPGRPGLAGAPRRTRERARAPPQGTAGGGWSGRRRRAARSPFILPPRRRVSAGVSAGRPRTKGGRAGRVRRRPRPGCGARRGIPARRWRLRRCGRRRRRRPAPRSGRGRQRARAHPRASTRPTNHSVASPPGRTAWDRVRSADQSDSDGRSHPSQRRRARAAGCEPGGRPRRAWAEARESEASGA